ncbi:hypothetical protein ACUNV4_25155 [Granulosicoccus sp. 3-233]|uniref:hypothetical protein n=1 Tax=Granulosicoccus sp. 3-233 TaxID=3417969 RepID=UPI003D332C9F
MSHSSIANNAIHAEYPALDSGELDSQASCQLRTTDASLVYPARRGESTGTWVSVCDKCLQTQGQNRNNRPLPLSGVIEPAGPSIGCQAALTPLADSMTATARGMDSQLK